MMTLEAHYTMLLGLTADWKVTSVDLSLPENRVRIRIDWNGGDTVLCPECGQPCKVYDLREEREWRHLDTMQFETVIVSRTPRSECATDGILTVSTPWGDKHGRFTLLFEAFAIRVLQASATINGAQKLLGLSWYQVDEIRKRAVARGLQRREEEPIDYVGIDEKSFGKRHDYISVMTDLKQGRVLEVIPERKQEAAVALLETLSPTTRESVMAVAMNMWPAFMNAARKVLPEALIVHDKFHVVKHLGEAVDKVRQSEHRALQQAGDQRLKGAKYLVLKNPEKMVTAQRRKFEQLRRSRLKTARAWAIKDAFQEFWTFDFVQDARAEFDRWYGWAIRSRLEPIKKKARMLKKHLKGLLNYTIHPITNAATEGLNSKIQTIKANARGFRSFASYRTAILFYCGKLDMLPTLRT